MRSGGAPEPGQQVKRIVVEARYFGIPLWPRMVRWNMAPNPNSVRILFLTHLP
jgi:hypothetical protein